MIAQQTNVDTIADNLANVNTTGFKAGKAEFKSLLYQTLQTRTTTANGDPKPVGAQVGLGVRNCSIDTSFRQGAMLESQSDTDFGISGDGFLQFVRKMEQLHILEMVILSGHCLATEVWCLLLQKDIQFWTAMEMI